MRRSRALSALIVAAFILGAALVAAGTALIYPPAGVIVAGLETIAGAYAAAYIQARGRR